MEDVKFGNISESTWQLLNENFQNRTTDLSLQNAFALTAHKTQSVTLPQTSLYLHNQMFAPDQSYVALSRCQSWNDIQILSLSPDTFLVDERIKKEYDRLEQISNQILPI